MAISVMDGFDYGGKDPNFSRDLFATVADMVAFSENYLPPVFECNVIETGKRYRYNVSNIVDPDTGKWRAIGEGTGDLSNYFNKAEINTKLEDYVLKEENKGLTKNEYTDEEKQKVTDATDAIEVINGDDTTEGSMAKSAKDTYEAAVAYVDEELEKYNDDDAIACDELPTYSEGVITYKENGETKTTEDINTWFYYTEDELLKQTKFINGVAKTITSGGGVDFSKYVDKEVDVTSTFTGTEVETSKIPDIAALKALKTLADEETAKKVDIAQGVDNKDKILGTDEDGNVTLLEKSDMGGKAEFVSYENESHAEWNNVKKAIDGIIAKLEYVKPEIKTFVSDAQAIYEKGASVASIVFNWTLNKDVISQVLTDCTVAAADRTATYDTELKNSKTFTLTVSDGENSASKSVSVSFQDKIYFGGAEAPVDYDSAFILALAKSQFATAKKGSYAVTVGAGQYGYIAYPKSMGQIASVYIGGFETTVENCGDISFTNASGGNSVYNIVRTGRQGLGSITMEVK